MDTPKKKPARKYTEAARRSRAKYVKKKLQDPEWVADQRRRLQAWREANRDRINGQARERYAKKKAIKKNQLCDP